MDKVVELLKERPYVISKSIFNNYLSLNIAEKELIVLIYLLNTSSILNYQAISNDLKYDIKEVMIIVNNLTEKGLLNLELKKMGSKNVEVFNLDGLYSKLSFQLAREYKTEDKKDPDLFTIFEKEFGRTLSPMDYEIINAWQQANFETETIKLALKEAVYNGVTNLRYIDKILFEWKKKGIKTKQDIEKERVNHQKKKTPEKELFDYDWTNEE